MPQLQTVFLSLLDASARSVGLKRNLERKLHFGVIVSLLLREEFRYASITSRLEQGDFDVLAGYTHQLSACTRETVDCLQDVNEYSDAATINSCMKILAIAFIRLPNFRDIYTAQLTAELAALAAYPEDEAQSQSTRNVLEACDKCVRSSLARSSSSIAHWLVMPPLPCCPLLRFAVPRCPIHCRASSLAALTHSPHALTHLPDPLR